MGDITEFSEKLQDFLKTYPIRKFDPVPWTPLKKPLAECKLALVSSAGFITPDQEPFERLKGGDFSYREIPFDIDTKTLRDDHPSKSYDHTGLQQDLNVGFPIDRVRELVEQGRIGSVNHRHFSFMGAISACGRLATNSAPEVAQKMLADEVDIALLVPV
jgi:D-proline reductase (dithiol) PrdB